MLLYMNPQPPAHEQEGPLAAKENTDQEKKGEGRGDRTNVMSVINVLSGWMCVICVGGQTSQLLSGAL